MGKTSYQFLLDAHEWPLGGFLATAVGTAKTRKEGIELVKKLMEKNEITDASDDKAGEIYDAVKGFLENTGFSFKPNESYWSDESIHFWGDPCWGIY